MFVQEIFRNVHVYTFEPTGYRVHADTFVNDFCVGSAVYQIGIVKHVVPELGAFGDGVLVEFPKRL